ncbi:hypothetical protein Tco_1470807, partial [Tanacetum coccineum]
MEGLKESIVLVFGQRDKGKATGTGVSKNTGNATTNQARVIRYYNCRGEGHVAKLCTQPRRAHNLEWFKEKMMLAQAHVAGVSLDEEQLSFLVDARERVDLGPDAQVLTTNTIFRTDDLDAFDSDCDEYSEQPVFVDNSDIDITSDSNVISYDQNLKENKSEVVQGTTSSKQQDAMIMFVLEELSNQVAKCNAVNQKNKIVNESLTAKLERY